MNKLIPNYVFDTIYDITPKFLKDHKISGVLIDLDGTMAPHTMALPPETVTIFINELKKENISVMVFSNNHPKRVGLFADKLGVPFVSHAKKPFQSSFHAAAKQMGLEMEQVAVIGDQIFTDVFGGNNAGALTCYVETMDRNYFWVNVRYQLERGFIARGRKRMKARANHE